MSYHRGFYCILFGVLQVAAFLYILRKTDLPGAARPESSASCTPGIGCNSRTPLHSAGRFSGSHYIENHPHLLSYKQFARKAPVDNFVLHAITHFDHICYKTYLDANIEFLDTTWRENVNNNSVQSVWKMQECGGDLLSACDVARWNDMFELFKANEEKTQRGNFSLYTHLDPDYFLVYNFTMIQWMTDCIRNGMAVRQFYSNLEKPFLSMSHFCISHRLMRDIGGVKMFGRYMTEYGDKQTALYALVLEQLFDNNYADMMRFNMGSVHSEHYGIKLEKPKSCQHWPNATVASAHLPKCQNRKPSDIECMLEKIRAARREPILNWKMSEKKRKNLKTLGGVASRGK